MLTNRSYTILDFLHDRVNGLPLGCYSHTKWFSSDYPLAWSPEGDAYSLHSGHYGGRGEDGGGFYRREREGG